MLSPYPMLSLGNPSWFTPFKLLLCAPSMPGSRWRSTKGGRRGPDECSRLTNGLTLSFCSLVNNSEVTSLATVSLVYLSFCKCTPTLGTPPWLDPSLVSLYPLFLLWGETEGMRDLNGFWLFLFYLLFPWICFGANRVGFISSDASLLFNFLLCKCCFCLISCCSMTSN